MEDSTKAFVKIAALTGCLLDSFDQYEKQSFVRQRLKQTSKAHHRELLRLEDEIVNRLDKKSVQDLVDSYQVVDNIFDIWMSIDGERLEDFDKELEKLIEKYKK